MNDRRRKSRWVAFFLSMMMVLTTTLSGFTAYADNAGAKAREQGEETISDVARASSSDAKKATSSNLEPNWSDQSKPGTAKKEISEEELYELSDEGKLTKTMISQIGMVEPQDTIDVEQYFDFTCIVDDENEEQHTDLKDYVMNEMTGLGIKSLPSGSIENAAPKTIFYNEHNHMYRRAVVGNTPVYYAGILNVGGIDYVYYVTSQKNTDRTVYSILKDDEKINLLYVHKNAYTISYELENETQDAENSALTVDDVFGEDRMTAVEENGSYTFKVKIPRGYMATVEITDADGTTVDVAQGSSAMELGKMMEYSKPSAASDNVELTADSPKAMILNGTYGVDNVTKNQTVRLKYKKIKTFKFSAAAWSTTKFANKSAWRIRGVTVHDNPQWTGTFGYGDTYTWVFTGNTTHQSTYEMNQLELNGEAIEVPMVTMADTQTVTNTTTMSTGTKVTISVKSNNGINGSSATRQYTVTIENCYEDITVSGGNMVGHQHKEIAVRRLVGATAQYAAGGMAPGAAGWSELESDTLIARKDANAKDHQFRVSMNTGYGKPTIKILPKDALSTLQENGSGGYLKYLYYSSAGAVAEERSYDSWTPSYDGKYYFRTSPQLAAYMDATDAQGVVLLEIQGTPTKVAVDYLSGGDQKDESGNMISPVASNIVNMPGFDDGGTNGYNTVDNGHVMISTMIPRDLSGTFEFDHWQVLTVRENGTLGEPKENAVYTTGQSAHLTTDSFINLSDCYRWDDQNQRNVFTMQAVWKKETVDTPISYVVHYYLDDQEIYAETHTANKGATLLVDAWKTGNTELSDAMNEILSKKNYAGKDYTEKEAIRYTIDPESTIQLQNLQMDNNTLNVYFVTVGKPLKVKKQWSYADGQTKAPTDLIRVQIQRKTDSTDWTNVEENGTLELTSRENWEATSAELPLYQNDDLSKPYTYRIEEKDETTRTLIENGKMITFPATDGGEDKTFLVNYQKQGDTWKTLNAETPTGALSVSNTVSGTQGDQHKNWNFTVTEEKTSRSADGPLNGSYGDMEFKNGAATFQLKHGESMTAVGLPVGVTFKVTEAEANTDGYVSACNGAILSDDNSTTFLIASNQTVRADFLNTKDLAKTSVSLQAVKYVILASASDAEEDDDPETKKRIPSDDQKFTFYLKDENGHQLQTVENTNETIKFADLEFDKSGDYTYYLMEANGGDSNIQYSNLVYEANVHVQMSETENKLEASVTYKIPGGGSVEIPEFQNVINENTRTSVRIVKHWDDGENAARPKTADFQLYKMEGSSRKPVGNPVAVSADKNGIWSYTWENLDKNAVWDVEEVNIPEGYEIASIEVNNNEWSITNHLKSSAGLTSKNVTVKKVWDDNGSTKRPEIVNVQLYENQAPHGEPEVLSADNNWTFTWTDLSADADWTVDEINVPDGYERSLQMETSEDQALATWTITNKQKQPAAPETVTVTANKVWEDANSASRPQSVIFQLYRDGEAYGDAVTVTADQGWRFIWNGLEKDHEWSVQEAGTIDGYTVSVGHDGNNWVITNTKKASGDHSGGNNGGSNGGGSSDDDDNDHDHSNTVVVVDNKKTNVSDASNSQNGSSQQTSGSTDPDGKSNRNATAVAPPDAFVKSGRPTPDSAGTDVADAGNVRKRDGNVPKTGDETHNGLWLLLAGLSLGGLAALILGKGRSGRKRGN